MKKLWLYSFLLILVIPMTVFAQNDGGETIEPFYQSDFKVLLGDVQRPNGIYWHDGFLYTSCAGDWTLYRIWGETGETITYMFGIKNTHSLYVEDDESGGTDVWAVDFQDNKFVSINPGENRGLYPIREGLAAPWGLTPSATDDTFFITEWESDNLINITRTGEITVVASGFSDPSGVVATADTIYLANNGSARRSLEWLDITEGADINPQPLVTGLQNVTNVVMGPDNLLYFTYALGTRGVVGRVDPVVCKENGGCTNVEVELVVWTDLAAPLAGLVVTPEKRLYV
ncbi:MAG TPA: hypothetical protein VJZ27_10015, partial [Aggregatilineales bacterium]|nr:hypothetical protein [Aggregatilineales bacterium]